MVDTDNPDNFKVSTMFEILDDAPPTYRITNTETHNKFGRQEQIKFLKWPNPSGSPKTHDFSANDKKSVRVVHECLE